MLQTIDDYIEKGLCHEIHNSERKSFNSCRRRWDWIYRGRHYPRTTAKPLEFGIAYHIGMETYYNPTTWAFPNDVKVSLAKTAFSAECEKQKDKALSVGAFFDDDIEADYQERLDLGLGMIEHYFSKIAPTLDAGFTPAKVEVEFMVKVPHPDTGEIIWCKCDSCKAKAGSVYAAAMDTDDPSKDDYWHLDPSDPLMFKGLPVVYAGRLDMLAVDSRGNYWIYDWKTASAITDNKEWLDLDDQVGSYVWALRSIGINVVGFVYHEQLKGYPKPPQRNAKPRNGCAFSVNKLQMTDHDTYLRTVANEDTEAWADGKYDDMLAFLKAEGKKFSDRRQIHKTEAQCDAVALAIGEQALDMISETLRVYPNSSRFNCAHCAFQLPCQEKNNGGDYQYALDTMYEKKPHYYEELRVGSTDKGV